MANVEQIEQNIENEEPLSHLELTLSKAQEEIRLLKLQIDNFKFHRHILEKDEKKCLYYTGLPDVIYVDVVFDLIKDYLRETATSALTKWEQLILTLMKLRKNFDFTELGYKFTIDRRTASRCFHNCLWVMFSRLKTLIVWPSRDVLHNNMPQSFKEVFGNKIAVIVDCFEIFIERPSTLQAQSQTFSHYKHHNTVKFLIGITPMGAISFISEAFGGRCSDKFITENCGFLNKLLPGDAVLADRGFLIDNSINLYMAEVITPAFLKGKKQLSPVDVETTRKIAHLRIHVERVIGTVRQKFNIVTNQIPIVLLNNKKEVTTVDQIVTVCCALTNLCPSVVSG